MLEKEQSSVKQADPQFSVLLDEYEVGYTSDTADIPVLMKKKVFFFCSAILI